ncbi:uncharacterized protein MYCGRDRAFT_95994 [Zymoseptoria tritici IPO323]|uniref:Uncharacterized protein n=1 Tax=Zymoseptoria tritici (strain CBS 115943 / IPO323) TaxID=336722 RepID=F9XKI6_ZYMTI|nr:uncharacterized protein MYCGRDRAFT_95994 [Zymoseptoria tritici IPO323]EGP84528.1 hypothetical protein MYCGRDRAFT_95994 [Zymoseptoria tritici IPO323]
MPRKPVTDRVPPKYVDKGKAMRSDKETTFLTAYEFNRNEFAFLAYLGFDNVRHGRQWMMTPPVLEAVFIYRSIGGPTTRKVLQAAAEVSLPQYQEKWDRDFAEFCPSPTAFLADNPVTLYQTQARKEVIQGRSTKKTAITTLTYDMMDTGQLEPLGSHEARDRVFAFLLWWLLRETERFDGLVSQEQEAEYRRFTTVHDFPYALPAFEDLQMEQHTKFPRPQWTHRQDVAPEDEALNRVGRALAFLPGWISRKDQGKANFSNGWHLFWVQGCEATFADCPINEGKHAGKWVPPWMQDIPTQQEGQDSVIDRADDGDSLDDRSTGNDTVNDEGATTTPSSGVKRTADDAGLPSGASYSELSPGQYGPCVDEDDEEHKPETTPRTEGGLMEELTGLAAALGPASKKLKLSNVLDQQGTRATTPDGLEEQRRQIAREGEEARQAIERPEIEAQLRAKLRRKHETVMAQMRREEYAKAEAKKAAWIADRSAKIEAEYLAEERAKMAGVLARIGTLSSNLQLLLLSTTTPIPPLRIEHYHRTITHANEILAREQDGTNEGSTRRSKRRREKTFGASLMERMAEVRARRDEAAAEIRGLDNVIAMVQDPQGRELLQRLTGEKAAERVEAVAANPAKVTLDTVRGSALTLLGADTWGEVFPDVDLTAKALRSRFTTKMNQQARGEIPMPGTSELVLALKARNMWPSPAPVRYTGTDVDVSTDRIVHCCWLYTRTSSYIPARIRGLVTMMGTCIYAR